MAENVKRVKSNAAIKAFLEGIFTVYSVYGVTVFALIMVVSFRSNFASHITSNIYSYFKWCCNFFTQLF